MPRIMSGQRIAHAFVSPTGAEEASQVLDFQLAADQGIEITMVSPYGWLHDDSPAPSDTVPYIATGLLTLHLEDGATDDLPIAAGADVFDIDSEIIAAYTFFDRGIVGATATFGASATMGVIPATPIYFPQPILAPRNITLKGTTVGTDVDAEMGMTIMYRYVEFSNAELGVLLARR